MASNVKSNSGSNCDSNLSSSEGSNVESNVGPRFKLAPIRSLDDFVLSSARFQRPDNWSERVINNLLYYQKNYLVFVIAMFVIIGMIDPINMLLGLMGNAISIRMISCAASPLIFSAIQLVLLLPLILTMICVCLISNALFEAMVFVQFSYLLVMFPVLIHASLRERTLPDNQESEFYSNT